MGTADEAVMKRLPYIDKIWIVKKDWALGRVFGIIKTKKRFREEMIRYFFRQRGPHHDLVCQLQAAPDQPHYLIVPYITRRGRPSMMFVEYSGPEWMAGVRRARIDSEGEHEQ